MATISLAHTSLSGKELIAPTIIATENVSTLKDLIRCHVEIAIREHSKLGTGPLWKSHYEPEVEKEFYLALAAFQNNEYLILINGRQMVSLDEMFALSDSTEVRFVKMIPLVGG